VDIAAFFAGLAELGNRISAAVSVQTQPVLPRVALLRFIPLSKLPMAEFLSLVPAALPNAITSS
jgi:hypothetical protein